MKAGSNGRNGSVIELLERTIEKEREAMYLYQHNANQTTNPEIKNMFEELATKRLEYYSEVHDQLLRLRSASEITTQINEMFE
jgi:rubrerythrin